MNPDHCSVVLVEPQGPLNIGSVCRAMMNFGFSDLRLVNPCRDFRSQDARKMALGAIGILDQAGLFSSLDEAIADCHTVFGTTRRFGKYRKDFLTPTDAGMTIAGYDDSYRCALVFGREDNGLKTSELDLCQHFITIPTDSAYASMNLSHSLAICLYEVAMARFRRTAVPSPRKASVQGEELEQMFTHMKKTLLDIEFLDPQNPDHLMRTFRRLFGRTGLSEREVRIVRGLMSRIDWTEQQRRRLSPAGSPGPSDA